MPPPAPRTATFLASTTTADLPARALTVDEATESELRLGAMRSQALSPLKEAILVSMLALVILAEAVMETTVATIMM